MDLPKNAVPRIHRQTLVEMNRAVFVARRDAAHARALDILQARVEQGSKEQRVAWYADSLRLIEEALRSTQRSQIPQDSPLIHYLKLLRDTLKAQLALVSHEITLAREAQEFSRLLGQETVARLLAAAHLFSDSERFVLDSIHDLILFGEPLRARDTEERQAGFAEDDHRRFARATAEYALYYRSFGC